MDEGIIILDDSDDGASQQRQWRSWDLASMPSVAQRVKSSRKQKTPQSVGSPSSPTHSFRCAMKEIQNCCSGNEELVVELSLGAEELKGGDLDVKVDATKPTKRRLRIPNRQPASACPMVALRRGDEELADEELADEELVMKENQSDEDGGLDVKVQETRRRPRERASVVSDEEEDGDDLDVKGEQRRRPRWSAISAFFNENGSSEDEQDEELDVKVESRTERRRNQRKRKKQQPVPVDYELVIESDEEEEKMANEEESKTLVNEAARRKGGKLNVEAYFDGAPLSTAKAKIKWPHRYTKAADGETPPCSHHYETAVVDGEHYKVGDCISVKGDGAEFLGKVLEFFKTTNGECWFRVQWFFRFGDTTIGELPDVVRDERRVFTSELEDDNFLECITGKANVAYIPPSDNFFKEPRTKASFDYYYDMGFRYEFSTFYKLPSETGNCSDERSSICNVSSGREPEGSSSSDSNNGKVTLKTELTLLDLYSGCGGMSTGLCMGASFGGVKLSTKWALDMNEHACASLKHNHPETEVRNEDAESFFYLLKEWQTLCAKYGERSPSFRKSAKHKETASDEYEVERIVGIRVEEVDKDQTKRFSTSSTMSTKPPKRQLEFKVRWRGYDQSFDTWEPTENLIDCEERISEFVREGRRKRLLPLPGEVDVICGGPPCQGASGLNRFRNAAAPLTCPRNRQMMIYMDIVEFLRPKYVLMENVVDILRFCGGVLGRYAMFRLVNMHYQAKLGLMVAGSYGLPQFRRRVFLWGAAPSETLPAFPLPTHEVLSGGPAPQDYLRNVVQHEEECLSLEKPLLLKDAISDLPPVTNSEKRNEMSYTKEPKTPFQHYIRSAKAGFYSKKSKCESNKTLHDHRPLQMNEDDHQRTCRVPKRKGANFRDLGGLMIRADNTVALDPDVEREYLSSGKPLVPDYAISFVKGRSLKPFGRLWWDETVTTVVTRAQPHNLRLLHPVQDRVLTIRENARLQGFPDWYKLFGSVKERYIQVGNAVAIPVARALGYSLAMATKSSSEQPLLELPKDFTTG